MNSLYVSDSALTKLCESIMKETDVESNKRIVETEKKRLRDRFETEVKKTKAYISTLSKKEKEKFIKLISE